MMKNFFNNLLKTETIGRENKGLLLMEWVMLGYMALTTVMILFCYTRLVTPEDMLGGRARVLIITLLMWGLYRLVPCRLMMLVRIVVQLALLSWWYPDTYEINRILPNLDHVFAGLDQTLFGCQPSLRFSEVMPWRIWSEMMYMGYFSYYLMMAFIALLYLVFRYEHAKRTAFILLASFFLFYTIYIFLPVTGPQYYFAAIGIDNAAHGILPDVGHHFLNHQDLIPAPGTEGDFFRSLICGGSVHEGERPTAAFPSSHVGVATIVLLLLIRYCRLLKKPSYRLVYCFLPFYILLCMSTVYIHAHYLVDALAGFVFGVAFFYLTDWIYSKTK